MNFSSTNKINQKRSLETQQKGHNIFTIPLFLAMVGPSMIFFFFMRDILLFYFRVILRLQYFHNKF